MQGTGEGVTPLVLKPRPRRPWAMCSFAQACQNERVVLGERGAAVKALRVGTGRGHSLWVASLFHPLQVHAARYFQRSSWTRSRLTACSNEVPDREPYRRSFSTRKVKGVCL